MVLLKFTKEEFMLLGLQLCGYSVQTIDRNCDATNLSRFKDNYYITPTTCSIVFEDIQSTENGARIDKPNPKYWLLALYYLKKYPTKHQMAGFLDVREATALTNSKKYVDALQGLKEMKIKWIFENGDLDERFIVSVDGIHCRIWEPRLDPSSKWYSKKHNGAGLVYEIGIAIWHNQLVWINGPFPAGQNDWVVFTKENGLKDKIPEGKKVVGDKIYRHDRTKVGADNEHDDRQVAKFKQRVKARHESGNCRIKSFGIIEGNFRSTGKDRLAKHKAVFEACCVLVQYEMENGRPLFKV